MNDFLYKFWNDRKSKRKHRDLNFAYFTEELEKMLRLFEYENTPEGIDLRFLEEYLLLNGTVGITEAKRDNGYVAFIGGHADDLNEYGVGQNYIGASVGESYEFKINEGGIVGLNNSIMTGRVNMLERYAGLLASIEESIGIGVINSRIIPLLKAQDDKDREQIMSIVNQIKNGELAVISSDSSSIFDSESGKLEVLDITDTNSIAKLQHYSRLYDDTLKRFWIESGIEITSKDKSAQVTSEELNSFAQYSRITIEDMLECREKMCDDFNKLYGGEWTVNLAHYVDNEATKEDGLLEEAPEDEKEVEDNGRDSDNSDNDQ
jgi:hypothetical protein